MVLVLKGFSIVYIGKSQINEMIETYDDMDYEDFDTFCDYYTLPFADYEVNNGRMQLHAFMQELRVGPLIAVGKAS